MIVSNEGECNILIVQQVEDTQIMEVLRRQKLKIESACFFLSKCRGFLKGPDYLFKL